MWGFGGVRVVVVLHPLGMGSSKKNCDPEVLVPSGIFLWLRFYPRSEQEGWNWNLGNGAALNPLLDAGFEWGQGGWVHTGTLIQGKSGSRTSGLCLELILNSSLGSGFIPVKFSGLEPESGKWSRP